MKNITCIGLSSDWRTNRWSITCNCGKVFEPPTTMYSCQNVECTKCGLQEMINYNEIVDKRERKNK